MQTASEHATPAPERSPSRSRPRLTRTDRVLVEMLKENTGRSMLDSGDAYGRNWQRNQGRDFLAEPATLLCIREYDGKPEIEVTHNVFHWLRDRLEYDSTMTRRFRQWANRGANRDRGWLELMEEWTDENALDFFGLYGKGRPFTVNTYNGEDLLSQTLQYRFFHHDGTDYVLLQIHGGCDVRGGYTAPRVFQVLNDGADIFDNAKATIVEVRPALDHLQQSLPGICAFDYNQYWRTDDGYHWYPEGCCGAGYKQLEDYEATRDPAERGQGKIFIDADGVAYGPHFGGRLEGSF